MPLPLCVWLSVSRVTQKLSMNLFEFFGVIGCAIGNERFDFGGDLDRDAVGILKEFLRLRNTGK